MAKTLIGLSGAVGGAINRRAFLRRALGSTVVAAAAVLIPQFAQPVQAAPCRYYCYARCNYCTTAQGQPGYTADCYDSCRNCWDYGVCLCCWGYCATECLCYTCGCGGC